MDIRSKAILNLWNITALYAARIAKGHTVRDNYGMWVTLDKGDDAVATQVGHSLAGDYPAIAHYTIDELEAREGADAPTASLASEAEVPEEEASVATGPNLGTVVEVLTFAREKIASLTGMPVEAVKLDLKMGL